LLLQYKQIIDNAMLKKITDTLTSRVARNLYFWLVVGCMRITGYEVPYTPGEGFYCLLFLAILLVLIYLNNLVLVPRLLARKKYILYLLSIAATIYACAYASARLIEYQYKYHPDISPFKTVWAPFGKEAILEEHMMLVIHAFMFLIYVFIFTLCWYANDYRRKQKEVQKVKQQQTETELRFLKDQLNPHFLFNTLNNLYGLSLKGGNEVSQPILQLSYILRYLLYESNTELASFGREKQIMQAYIELELLRLSDLDNINFSITADADYTVPPLLWLPVLENVFKHSRHRDSEIEFRCSVANGMFHIFSRNSYEMQPAQQEGQGGIGMSNLRKRLELLYPGRYTMTTGPADGYYIADIKIQLA
jgi:two-component system LytT family sensor kinase